MVMIPAAGVLWYRLQKARKKAKDDERRQVCREAFRVKRAAGGGAGGGGGGTRRNAAAAAAVGGVVSEGCSLDVLGNASDDGDDWNNEEEMDDVNYGENALPHLPLTLQI